MKPNQLVLLYFLFTLILPNWGQANDSIVFAVDPTKPPMQYIDQKGELVGFEIDLVKEMAKQGDFTPIFKKVPWMQLFSGLEEDQYDAACASISITDARKDQMEFTTPYYQIAQAVLALPGGGISTIKDLAGKKLGVKKGTTSQTDAENIPKVNAVPFPDIPTAIQALYAHEVDAIMCDGPVAGYYAVLDEKKAVHAEIVFVVEDDWVEMYGIAVKRGNKEVKNRLSRALQNIQTNTIIELQKKWFSGLLESP
ncbi:MAG: polar amino acid transport system substrate-binding protein [Desulforhopalus sp.]|jgi:polar amino acid transport system substrate-binding protein